MGKGRESKTKTEIAGAFSEEWLSGVHRKTGHLATDISVSAKFYAFGTSGNHINLDLSMSFILHYT